MNLVGSWNSNKILMSVTLLKSHGQRINADLTQYPYVIDHDPILCKPTFLDAPKIRIAKLNSLAGGRDIEPSAIMGSSYDTCRRDPLIIGQFDVNRSVKIWKAA